MFWKSHVVRCNMDHLKFLLRFRTLILKLHEHISKHLEADEKLSCMRWFKVLENWIKLFQFRWNLHKWMLIINLWLHMLCRVVLSTMWILKSAKNSIRLNLYANVIFSIATWKKIKIIQIHSELLRKSSVNQNAIPHWATKCNNLYANWEYIFQVSSEEKENWHY